MGTRSRIGVMHGEVLKSVYCHWDGYLDHNGRILLEYYDSAKANNLVALGDLSSLRSEIGEKHAFSQFDLPAEEVEAFKAQTEDWCTFYGRDRGETGTEYRVTHDFVTFLERVDACGAEYYYIMRDGEWFVGTTYGSDTQLGSKLVPLAVALADHDIQDFLADIIIPDRIEVADFARRADITRIAASALSPIAANDRPGGTIKPFCEPAMVTSTFHSSCR